MSASTEYTDYIMEKLVSYFEVKHGRFFGGVSVKCDGLQFGMIMGNVFYLCVDDQSRKGFEDIGSEPFSYMTKKGRVFVRKYYSVPEDIIEDEGLFQKWCSRALDSALSNKKK